MADIILGRLKFKWQGEWNTGTAYIKDDIIRYGGNTYTCVINHTSDASDFYVDLSAQRWNLMTPGFEWKGTWLPSSDQGAGAVRYKINDVISYGPNVYICLQGHATGLSFEPDLDAGYWQIMTTGFANKGVWTNQINYTTNDVVTYGAAVYICIEDHTPDESTDTSPPLSEYWQKLVDGMQYEGTYDVNVEYVEGDVVKFGGYLYYSKDDNLGTRPDDTSKWDVLVEGYDYQGEFVPGVGTEYKPGQVVIFSGKVYVANQVTTALPTSSEWDLHSEGTKWQGKWDGSTTYYPGDIVLSGAQLYLNMVQIQSTTSPTDNANWELMMEGTKWAGEYDNAAPYLRGDIVKQGARTYICTQDHPVEGANPLRDYYVTVASTANGNKYELNGLRHPNLEFREGGTYTFTLDDSSTTNHAMYFSETNNGVLDGGTPFENGVTYYLDGVQQVDLNAYLAGYTTATTRKIVLVVDQNTPETLYYLCYYHLNMHSDGTTPATITSNDGSVRATPDASVYFELLNDGGYRWMNIWDTTEDYVINDVVRHGGRSYIARKNNASSDPSDNLKQSYVVTVTSEAGGNKYRLDGNLYPSLTFKPGGQYTFVGDDPSMANHPIYFSTTNNGVLNAGVEFEDGVKYYINGVEQATVGDYITNWATATTRKITIDVTYDTPETLYYLCYYHNNMHSDGVTPATITNGGTDWDLLHDGFIWQGNWDTNTEYKIGDVVEYATNSYISIIPANQGNQPDLDNDKWNLMSQGDTNGLHTTRGDIVIRGPVNVERLPIGPAGSYLYSDGVDVKWGFQNPSNTFYVSLTGSDADGDGRTPATAWRTIHHAAQETYNNGQCSISLFAGTYEEQCPIKLGRGVVLEGQGLGAVSVSPNNSRDEGYGIGISDDGSTPNANSEVFHVNNAVRIRNVVFRGFSTGSVQVSLDPGTGPDDTSVWITSQSPYVQNCTNFSPEGTGMLIDGGLHNGGYKSMVANDWTQINSDGIGVHVRNDGRCELVSVFTYYCAIGYLAESGGKIRAVNGSSAYGELGVKADGYSQAETPLEGRLRLTADTLTSVQTIGTDAHIFTTYRDETANYVYVGHINPTGTDTTSSWDNTTSVPIIAKYNSGGDPDWVYTYTGAFGTLHSVVETSDAYFCGGIHWDGAANRGFVLKITKSGEIQFQKTISSTDEIVDMVTDGSNTYIIGNHSTNGVTVIKINAAGLEQWSRSISYSSGSLNTMKASCGAFTVAPGNSEDTYENNGNADAENKLFVMMRDDTNNTSIMTRLSTLGILEESYEYGDITFNDLALDNGNGDGIYFMAVGKATHQTVDRPFAMRIRLDGTVAWQKQLASGSNVGAWHAVKAQGDWIYTSGYFNNGSHDYGVLMRISSNGNTIQYTKDYTNGTDNIALYGVELNGVNIITGGINNANSVIFDVQRDNNDLGTLASGSWTITTNNSYVTTDDTLAEATTYSVHLLSPVLTAASITDYSLRQDPTQVNTVIGTRAGFAGIGTGVNFSISDLARIPKEGSVIQIAGIDQDYFAIAVDNFIESFGDTQDNNPNVYDQLNGNRLFIEEEVIGWINTNYPQFTYDEAKCRRDSGIIIDAAQWDSALGTNYNSVTAGLAYQRATTATLKADQLTETIGAIEYIRDTLSTAVAASSLGQSRVEVAVNEVLDIIQNGVTSTDTAADPLVFDPPTGTSTGVINAVDQIQANRTFLQEDVVAYVNNNNPPAGINVAVCGRDTGYIADALCYDLLYGGNSATRRAATAYFENATAVITDPGEITATVNAFTHLKGLIGDVVLENSITPESGNTETQDTSNGAGTASEVTSLDTFMDYIIDAIQNGVGVLPNEVVPDLQTLGITEELRSTANIIGNLRTTLVNDTIDYINDVLAFVYDEATCRRDIGLIIDGLLVDLDSSTPGTYEQNDHSIDAGLEYWNGSVSILPPSQKAQTVAALNYMNSLVGNVLNGIDPSVPYSGETRYDNLLTPETGAISIVTTNMSTIATIADLGPSSAPARSASGTCRISIEPAMTSNLTPDDNTQIFFRESFSQVRMTGHDFLDIGTGGFADTNYPVIIQADYTQQPDQARETLATNGGRVFYVTTDQDGNFRVGDYFKVEQATGRATLSSEEFDLTGLNELQLGSITAGKTGATINEFSTDGTMADNSDTSVPTERAIVTYVGDQIQLALSRGGGTSHIALPVGTTAQRPDPAETGFFRYNDTNGALEVYGNSGTWEAAGSVRWIITTTNTAINKSEALMVDTSAGAVTITLPGTAAIGDTIRIMDLAGTFDTNNCTIARNGNNIMSLSEDLVLSTENAAIGLVYTNATHGWKLIEVL